MTVTRPLVLFLAFASSANAQFGWLRPGNEGRNRTGGILGGPGIRNRISNATSNAIKAIEERTGIDIPDPLGNPDAGFAGTAFCGVAIGTATRIDAVAEFITADDIDCNCGTNGGYAHLDCEITREICVEEGICGTVAVDGTYFVRGRNNEEYYRSTGCFDLTTDGYDMKDFCVELDHSGVPEDLTNPEVFIFDCDMWAKGPDGRETCNSCASCNDNTGIAFNCSNVDLDKSPDAEFIIPSDGECMSLLGANNLMVGDIMVPMPQFVK